MISRNVCFGLLFLPVLFGVDMDYLARVPRSLTLKCQSVFHTIFCHIKCGEKNAICLNDNCFCLSASAQRELKRQNLNDYDMEDEISDLVEKEDEVQDQTRIDSVPIYALRPTVRHHIAHFCPNLDVARECIKKCMAQGKPAFCGKDHVCYCGHKYSNTDNDSNVNIKDMYAQFHDLYAKYFGADHSIEH